MNYMSEDAGLLEAFNSVEFKQAVSMTVDRQGIIDSAVYGYLSDTTPPNSGLPPGLLGYENEEATAAMEPYLEYDVEGAKQILADAGFVDIDGDGYVETPSGLPIEIEIVSPAGWTDWNDGAAISAEGMRAAGINATAQAKDLSLVTQHWANGDWSMLYTANGSSSDIYRFYWDTIANEATALTDTWWTVCQTNYVNDEINALIQQLPTATTDEEVKTITDQVELHFAENMINIPVLYNGNWFVYNDSRFTGWSTEENMTGQPALCINDSKVLQLLKLEAVE